MQRTKVMHTGASMGYQITGPDPTSQQTPSENDIFDRFWLAQGLHAFMPRSLLQCCGE